MSERVNPSESTTNDSAADESRAGETVDRLATLEAENERLREKVERIESALKENQAQSASLSGSFSRRALLGTLGIGGLLGFASSGAAAAETDQTTLEVGGSYSTTSGHGIELTEASTQGFRYGVRGIADSPKGRGVFGEATASTGNTYGLWGRALSDQGVGLSGTATNSTGNTVGVLGTSRSIQGSGVQGSNPAGSGVTYGVRGAVSSPDGFGIYTPDDAKIDGDLVVEGTKNFAQSVNTPHGPQQIRYTAIEAGDVRTEYSEVVDMSEGRVSIDLPAHFQEVTSEDESLVVQVTPYTKEAAQPHVVESSTDRVVVEEAGSGQGEYTLAVTVKGIREGFEDKQVVYSAE